jgi:O-antigen/teichoic acid export membrane protein
MHRNAYALILSTVLTSVLGLVFWVVAARWLPASAVGTGASLTSAMTFLATLSTLGLRNALIRFLALAGSSAKRFVVSCYGICLVTAMAAGTIFIVGQPWWAKGLDLLRGSASASVFFIVSTMVWVIFILQDHVLIGLRRAVWVPVSNGGYSLAKIALLPFLGIGAGWVVFSAFVVPAAFAVLFVTILIWSIVVKSGDPVTTTGRLHVVSMIRFAASDHVAALIWLATTDLMTLVILQIAGPAASAYYFMAFTMAYTLYLVSLNIGSALVAEAASDPGRTRELTRRALRNAVGLVVPLAILGALIAPVILQLLGHDYADNGTGLLRLLLLSSIPYTLVVISISLARIRQNNRIILTIYISSALGVFGGSWMLIQQRGLFGVGLAWLVTQMVVGLTLLFTILKRSLH